MDKLLMLMFILAIILFSGALQSRAEARKNNNSVIITAEVPFYYLEYSFGKYMKVDRRIGLMPPPETLINYSNKTNHLGTYFLNLLVIPDHVMYKKLGPMAVQELQVNMWSAVDKYFQKLTKPKIKLAISGIVFPTEDFFGGPSVENGEKFYVSNETLYKVSKWLKDNEDSFEGLKYDAFVYVTSWPLKNYDTVRQLYINDISMSYPFVCDYKKHKNSENTKPPGGILYYNHDRSKFDINNIYGTHLIADGFSVPFDQDVGCKGGYLMDNWDRNHGSSWSGCSLSAFEKIISNNSYACMEMTRESMHDEDDYDD